MEPRGLQIAPKRSKVNFSCVSFFSRLRNHHEFVNAYKKKRSNELERFGN